MLVRPCLFGVGVPRAFRNSPKCFSDDSADTGARLGVATVTVRTRDRTRRKEARWPGSDTRSQRPVTLTRRRPAGRGLDRHRVQGAQRPRPGRRRDPRSGSSTAADRLSFSPNPLARGLLAGRTGTVGLLTSDLEGRFVIPILMGAEDAFGAGQVNVFLCDARGDTIREQHQLRALLSRRVDGLIVVGRQTDPRPSLGHDIPVPVVYAYAPSDDPADLSLTPDNVGAGRMAVEHLHRAAAAPGSPTSPATPPTPPPRTALTGARAGARRRRPRAGRRRRCSASGPSAGGATPTALLLAQHPDVDAILCGSDQIARGALDTARDLGRRRARTTSR